MSVTFRNCEWKNCCKSFQASRKDQAHCSKSCQTQDARWKRRPIQKESDKNQVSGKRSRITINRNSLENRDWILDVRTGKLQYAPKMDYKEVDLPSLDEHLRKDPTHAKNLEASRPSSQAAM
jgi:hypothetical protein